MSESLINWEDQIHVASLSDLGMRRANNQDNLTISLANSIEHYQRKGHLFVVADGMGAHAAGELASKLAIDHIPHLYHKFNDSTAPEELRLAVSGANEEIHRRGQANEDFYNMGTTCCALALLPQGAVVAHIGDSRVYRLSQNRLEQLTFDHSLVWEMKAAGQLTPEEEAAGKIPSNVITRSLGPYPECNVDLEGPFPVQVGDTFLLCTDGLTGVISDAEIGAILANLTPDEAAQVLVDLANLRGGPDNITVVIAKIAHPQMATSIDTAPIRVNAKKTSQSVSPLMWTLVVASFGLALLFWFWSGWKTALLPGIVSIASFVWAMIRLISAANSGQTVSPGTRLGKGPYTRVGCALGSNFSTQLSDILDQLQESARRESWKINWEQLQNYLNAAKHAIAAKDHAASIRAYCRAISFMMDQLRHQSDTSSSSVEL